MCKNNSHETRTSQNILFKELANEKSEESRLGLEQWVRGWKELKQIAQCLAQLIPGLSLPHESSLCCQIFHFFKKSCNFQFLFAIFQ